MRNLEHPIPQTFYEHTLDLLSLRYIEAMDRLDDPERSFFTFAYTELLDVPFVRMEKAGPIFESIKSYAKDKTDDSGTGFFDDARDLENTIDPHNELLAHERTMTVIEHLAEILNPQGFVSRKLINLTHLSIIAAQHKPAQDRLEHVSGRQAAPDLTSEEMIFRRALSLIQSQQLPPAEELALAKKIPRYLDVFDRVLRRDTVGLSENTVLKSMINVNIHQVGMFAKNLLERLMDPSTTKRNVLDDIAVFSNAVGEPPAIPRESDEPAPIIWVPYPLLPPGQGVARQPVVEDQPSGATTSSERRRQQEYPHLADWIGALPKGWEFGGKEIKVDLPSGDKTNEYIGALLNGADGQPFIVVADTARGDNALYYAVEGETFDPDTGNPVSLLDVFANKNKEEAKRLGAKRVEHRGLDFHSTVMDIIITKALERLERM